MVQARKCYADATTMSTAATSTLYSRISRFAADRRIHQAFRWFHLNDGKLMEWQRELVSIPAPPFGEAERAVWLAERLEEQGLDEVHIDNAGNAVGIFSAEHQQAADDPIATRLPVLLISAHLDTVFPAGTPIAPVVDNRRLTAPGACDNAAGVIGLLALASALKAAEIEPGCPIVFAGNVGEEGEGDLRGTRYLYTRSLWANRIAAHLVLDGAGDALAVNEALGSRRFLVTIEGPGGHSWSDADTPNPIAAMAEAIVALSHLQLPLAPRTTLNVGTIEGGSAVNAVPEAASARFDLRSSDGEQLSLLETELRRAIEKAVDDANGLPYRQKLKVAPLRFQIEKIGDRPAGRLPDDAPILETLRAVDRHLGLQTQLRLASTDANIPLSMGISALSLGAGGDGGGVHTRNEWFDSTGRELALKRLLLLLLALAQDVNHENANVN
jgi:acetylornithine deacetylase/succinyl-diaminopimelate desuccinylase-like protein